MTGIVVPAAPGACAFVVYDEREGDYLRGIEEVVQVPLIGWSIMSDGRGAEITRPILGVARREQRKPAKVLIVMPDGVIWDAVDGDNYPDLSVALCRLFRRRGLPKNRQERSSSLNPEECSSPEIEKALAAYWAWNDGLIEQAKRRREGEITAPDRTLN